PPTPFPPEAGAAAADQPGALYHRGGSVNTGHSRNPGAEFGLLPNCNTGRRCDLGAPSCACNFLTHAGNVIASTFPGGRAMLRSAWWVVGAALLGCVTCAALAVEGSTVAGPIGGTDIRAAQLPPPGLYGGSVFLYAEAHQYIDGFG